MIIDTHCHLYYPELINNIDDILSRAKDNGIEKIIIPAVDLDSSRTAIMLSEKYEMLYCALGVHPCDADKNEVNIIDEIEKLITHEKVTAVGETGLDYYWNKSGIEKQKTFFKLQIELAQTYNLPIIIHTRNSVEDAIYMISRYYTGNSGGQFHCFSGNKEQLKQVLEFEKFYVSFCGNITYKNFADENVVRICPEDKILSETDSPFLPPVPFRGKKNEPSYIINTLKKISEIKEINYENFTDIVYSNANHLFEKLKT